MNTTTVATWNPEYGRSDRRKHQIDWARVGEEMALINPDVWVLTESRVDLSPGPSYTQVATSTAAADRPADGRWVVLWVRKGIKTDLLKAAGDSERSAGVRIVRDNAATITVFGTVLPWRSDTRHAEYRGAAAFCDALERQATDWANALRDECQVCVAGDFNQEYQANRPVGTSKGEESLIQTLAALHFSCVTGGEFDPLLDRGWRYSIDHILLSEGLTTVGNMPQVWPEVYPLAKEWPDHHGVAVAITDIEPA